MAAMDLRQVRAYIPALGRCVYLNCGTYGPLPLPVWEEVARLYQLILESGPFNPEVDSYLHQVYDDARASAASLLGASPEEIALTRNVSDGVNIVASGFDWQPGDEVVISNEEHPSGSLPWMNLASRKGVVVRLLKLTPDFQLLLSRLDSLITRKTRLVFLSHLSSRSGLLLPAKEIARLVKGKGVPLMLDGAHTIGQMPVDVKAIGCDFYATCGHKWLLAPQGTGFLYVAREWLEKLQVGWCGWGMTSQYDLDRLFFEPLGDARKFEFGTRSWALYGGLAAAAKFAQKVGTETIYSRTKELSRKAKEMLQGVRGIELITPIDENKSNGLVAFYTRGLEHKNPGQWLWENHRILVAHNPAEGWMRFSTAYFLPEEELELAVKRLTALSPSIAG